MSKLFAELGLSPELLKAIEKLGFEQAAPIQAEAIPLLMQGRDVVGQSQTGSGKTAAFAAPAIEKVDVTKRDTQVLILCPTRELAIHRLRRRYRELLREEIAQTLADPAQADEELRALFSALAEG